MDEIFEITEYVQEEAGQGTDLIWGNCFDESLGEKLSVTVIATGFNSAKKEGQNRTASNELGNSGNDKKVGPQTEKQQVRVNLDDEDDFSGFAKNSQAKMDYDSNSKQIEHQQKQLNDSVEPYHREERHKENDDRNKKLKTSSYKLDNPELISELENQPAYLRKGLKLDNVEHSSEKNLSRWVISDDNAPEIKDSNSYLHDNVD
jgi:cell division protein FtsZ